MSRQFHKAVLRALREIAEATSSSGPDYEEYSNILWSPVQDTVDDLLNLLSLIISKKDELREEIFTEIRQIANSCTPNQLCLTQLSDYAYFLEDTASLQPTPPPQEDIRTKYQSFYKEHFNLDADLSQVVIPEYQEGFDRIIIIAQGLTINQVIEACRKHFKVWTYTNDLDKAVTKNDRSPAEASYAIRIRDRVEADEELKNKSANQLAEENIKGITLLERGVLELIYFIETGNHLDIDNYTLCSGSRDSGGLVPHVSWYGGELDVHWYYLGAASGGLRGRVVVS